MLLICVTLSLNLLDYWRWCQYDIWPVLSKHAEAQPGKLAWTIGLVKLNWFSPSDTNWNWEWLQITVTSPLLLQLQQPKLSIFLLEIYLHTVKYRNQTICNEWVYIKYAIVNIFLQVTFEGKKILMELKTRSLPKWVPVFMLLSLTMYTNVFPQFCCVVHANLVNSTYNHYSPRALFTLTF